MSFPRLTTKCLLWAGWALALGLAVVLAYLLPRIHLQILEQPRDWQTALQQKKTELASVQWHDARPLLVWIGDSHIEMGNWYNLFSGAYAVRNCGMSMATVRDVRELVTSIPEKKPHAAVVMCGINSLTRGVSPENCIRDYEELIKTIRGQINPDRVVILAVMPVRQTLLDQRGREVNKWVSEFNGRLSVLSEKTGCEYVNVNQAITDPNGGLACRLTLDGLHLNSAGYRVFVSALPKKYLQ